MRSPGRAGKGGVRAVLYRPRGGHPTGVRAVTAGVRQSSALELEVPAEKDFLVRGIHGELQARLRVAGREPLLSQGAAREGPRGRLCDGKRKVEVRRRPVVIQRLTAGSGELPQRGKNADQMNGSNPPAPRSHELAPDRETRTGLEPARDVRVQTSRAPTTLPESAHCSGRQRQQKNRIRSNRAGKKSNGTKAGIRGGG